MKQVQKFPGNDRGKGGGGGGVCRAWFTGIKIKISQFTGIKTDFLAFDFICCPYSIAKLRYQLLCIHPKILNLQ